jgi:hypothetical protein
MKPLADAPDPKPCALFTISAADLLDPASLSDFEDTVQAHMDAVQGLGVPINMTSLSVGDVLVVHVQAFLVDRDPISGQGRAVPAKLEDWRRKLKQHKLSVLP